MTRKVDVSTKSVLVIGADDLEPIVKKVGLAPRTIKAKSKEGYADLHCALHDTNYLLIDTRRGFSPVAAYATGYAVSRGHTVIGIRVERPNGAESVITEQFAYWVETTKELESVLKVLNEGGREMDNDGTWGGGGH
jgi:hypothetical protein